MIFKKPPSKKNKISPKSLSSKLPKLPSKTESKSINQCINSSVKREKLYSSKCWSIIKDKKSINFNKWPDFIEKDWKELSKCFKRTWSHSTVIWMIIKKKQEMPSKRLKLKPEKRIKKLPSSKKNCKFKLISLAKTCQKGKLYKTWKSTKIFLKVSHLNYQRKKEKNVCKKWKERNLVRHFQEISLICREFQILMIFLKIKKKSKTCTSKNLPS